MKREEKAIVLGALLNGLHQFLQRPVVQDIFDIIKEKSADIESWTDPQLLIELLNTDLYTEDAVSGQSAQNILRRAAALAGAGLPKKGALVPAFHRVDIKSMGDTAPAGRVLPWLPLSHTFSDEPPPITAVGSTFLNPADIESHLQKMETAADHLCRRINWKDFDCVFTHWLSFLQQYAWCIPVDGQPDPADISLYDHNRVRSALAACLSRNHYSESIASESGFLLLAGDLSGIQDYIYDISTTGAGGVTRRLRARSFYVQMLSDIASLHILRLFDLPPSNLLMASGGNFYILLPQTADVIEKLSSTKRELDRMLLQDFHGTLAINLAWTGVKDEEFADGRYSQVMERLHQELRLSKSRRLSGALQVEAGWASQFLINEPFEGERVCVSCRRWPATNRSRDLGHDDDNDICRQCAQQVELGRDLARAGNNEKYIVFFDDPSSGRFPCLNWSFSIVNDPRHNISRRPYLLTRINNPDLGAISQYPAGFKYICNHIPHEDDGEPWTFTDIAAGRKLNETQTSNRMLGVLKADVDLLGLIFQEGLRRDAPENGFDSIVRVATLSRQVDWFFAGWLQWLLTREFSQCYAVYAGGDDLLIVGPREMTLDLARRINLDFGIYTGNPQITLSSGIAVVKPRLPVSYSVKQADDALGQAKSSGRNRLSLLGDVAVWNEFSQLYDEIHSLAGIARDKAIVPSGFLYRLLYFAQLYRSYEHEGKWEGLRYHALLSYHIGRALDAGSELDSWTRRLLEFPPTGQIKSILNHLRLIVQWVLFERREKKNDDIR